MFGRKRARGGRMLSGTTVFLKYCAFTRADLELPLDLDLIPKDRAARRRRNLKRGIDRWHVATCEAGLPNKPVLLMTLTFRAAEPDAARGAIRTFWHHYRDTFGRRPYFSWAELQFRGAVHYHAILVNPPWNHRGKAVRWIRAHWPHADITPRLDWREKRWFVERGGSYVKKYAADPAKSRRPSGGPVLGGDDRRGHKAYQQDYEDLPREIRTFEHSALEWYVKDVDNHIDRAICVNTAPDGADWTTRKRAWWLMHYLHHDPEPGACTLRKTKRRGLLRKRPRRFERTERGSHPRRRPLGVSPREPV